IRNDDGGFRRAGAARGRAMGWMGRVGSQARLAAAFLLLAPAARLLAQAPETTAPANDTVQNQSLARTGNTSAPSDTAVPPSALAAPAPPGQPTPSVARITA